MHARSKVNLGADFDDLIGAACRTSFFVSGVAAQVGEDRFGNAADDTVIAGHDRFVTDVIGRIFEVEGAVASAMRLR